MPSSSHYQEPLSMLPFYLSIGLTILSSMLHHATLKFMPSMRLEGFVHRTAAPAHGRRLVADGARWLVLILIGWLEYALVRALWAFVRLGAPLFDWQWYLSIIALLVILAARITWRLPRSTFIQTASVALLVWSVAGYFGWGYRTPIHPGRVPAVPISFWGSRDLTALPDTLLEDLQLAGGGLYIAAGAGAFDGENRQTLIEGLRRLAEHQVDVYLAVTASDYLSVPVHDEWATNVRTAAAFVQDERLHNVRGIIGDAEHPKNTPLDLLGSDRDAFFQAVHDLNGLIQRMGAEYPGLRLGITALWTLHLDNVDGDPDLSIIHRSSVDPPGGWDFVNVMTYSSYIPAPWRAYYVYIIERAMAHLYPGTRPSHLVGLTAAGRPGEPTIGFDDLVRDSRLSRAMGVPEIVVFKLNNQVLADMGDGFVRRLAIAVNDVPPDEIVDIPFSRPASMLVYATLFADALLDAQGWRGLLLLGWMLGTGFIIFGG